MNLIHDQLVPVGVDGLFYVDVIRGSSAESLRLLQEIHLENFGGSYAEATGDFTRTWNGEDTPAGLIEHQWLLVLEGKPVGQFVFEVNLNRKMVNRHFLSVRGGDRTLMPSHWMTSVMETASNVCKADAASHGIELLGMMSEIKPRHERGWRKLGHFAPNIGYQEPLHGNYWAEFGPLEFIPMVANILPYDAGRNIGLGQIAEAGVRAFLQDYYHVPEDDPILLEIVDRCRNLAPAW